MLYGGRRAKVFGKKYMIDKNDLKRIKKMFDELENKCDIESWTKIVRVISQGSYSSIKQICLSRNECSKYMVAKTTVVSENTLKDYINESIIIKYLMERGGLDPTVNSTRLMEGSNSIKDVGWEWFPRILEEFNCKCPAIAPLSIGIRIMPMYAITLYSILTEREHIKLVRSEKFWFKFFISMISVLSRLESLKICHNDLHTNNIMFNDLSFDGSANLKPIIIDWGLASSSLAKLGLYGFEENPSFEVNDRVAPENTNYFKMGKDLFMLCAELAVPNPDYPGSLFGLINAITMTPGVYGENISATEFQKMILRTKPKNINDLISIINDKQNNLRTSELERSQGKEVKINRGKGKRSKKRRNSSN